tara:strand:+ start:490 stop:642 length:153 start_codon:yes stop_codon:yes gene_type:complete
MNGKFEIESVVRFKIPTPLSSDKLFRMKGGEVEGVKGIEPSPRLKLQMNK